MPELPDLTVYLDHLRARTKGHTLKRVRVSSPFLLRTAEPPLEAVYNRRVEHLERIGKHLVFCLEGELFLVLHLMIAGRLRWGASSESVPKKIGLAAFDFSSGTLLLTEASTKKRAALFILEGREALSRFDRGGLEVLGSSLEAFQAALLRESHTLKRALTDPAILAGVGNAYSDEILHRARLSPLKLARQLTREEFERLHAAALETLQTWTERLREASGPNFPTHVSAFRDGMAVHGRYRLPCPDCGTAVQRIAYADNECNYCPRCQTDGRLLADRALSRLLKSDWPRTIDELERSRPLQATRRADGQAS